MSPRHTSTNAQICHAHRQRPASGTECIARAELFWQRDPQSRSENQAGQWGFSSVVSRAAVKVMAILSHRAHCPIAEFWLEQDDALLKKHQGLGASKSFRPETGESKVAQLHSRSRLLLHSRSRLLKRSGLSVKFISYEDQVAAPCIWYVLRCYVDIAKLM